MVLRNYRYNILFSVLKLIIPKSSFIVFFTCSSVYHKVLSLSPFVSLSLIIFVCLPLPYSLSLPPSVIVFLSASVIVCHGQGLYASSLSIWSYQLFAATYRNLLKQCFSCFSLTCLIEVPRQFTHGNKYFAHTQNNQINWKNYK